jgi:hypothetical protein
MNNQWMKLGILCCLVLLAGCSGVKQPEFEALHPATGKVQQAGAALTGGSLRFNPTNDKGEFIVNSLVGPDGSFSLTTVRTTDSKGERRNGAPAGEYSVVYTPESLDQTAAYQPPITLPQKFVIEAKENTLTLDVPVR